MTFYFNHFVKNKLNVQTTNKSQWHLSIYIVGQSETTKSPEQLDGNVKSPVMPLQCRAYTTGGVI